MPLSTAPAPTTVASLPDATIANDPRYPRPRALGLLRWVLRLAWLAFLLYPANALFNVIALIANGASLSGVSLAHALLLDRVLPLLTHYPVAFALSVILVMAIILLGLAAHLDQERENAVLRLRADHEHARVTAEAMAQETAHTVAQAEVHAATETTAAAIIERIDQHLATQPRAAESGTDPGPQGPPFDEALLPLPDHFLGREADLDWLLGRLRSGESTGITAVRGMGGIGKTTLAAVAVRAARHEGLFKDGIAVVPCLGLHDSTEVLKQALARFDPLRRQPRATALADLAEAAHALLDGKDTLIVLDNVEPQLAVAEVVAPLREAGAVLLLTARQALPRAAVPAEASRALDLLSYDEALNLFARALGYDGAEHMSQDEREAAHRILEALDRHTLAIKLAGAYAADVHRDLGALAHELEDPEQAMALPENETPHAVQQVFASSLEALPPETRRLFAALAAFATEEFGRRAAVAVGSALGLTQPASAINLLVLRALIVASTDTDMPEGSDRERLRIHPLLRAFAVTELAMWPESDRLRVNDALATYYASYVEHAQPRALARDEQNASGAIEWAHAQGRDALVVALCLSMGDLWVKRGRVAASERYIPWGVDAAQRIAQAGGSRDDELKAAELALSFAEMLVDTGRYDEAEAALLANLTLRRRLDDTRGAGRVLLQIGEVTFNRGLIDKSKQYVDESLTAFQAVQDRAGEGHALADLAIMAYAQGRLDESEQRYHQALSILDDGFAFPESSQVHVGLGHLARVRGRLDEAEQYYQRALVACREEGDRLNEADVLRSLGMVEVNRQRLDAAESYLSQALAISQEARDYREVAVVLMVLGDVALASEDHIRAQTLCEQSLALAQQVHDRTTEGRAMYRLGLAAEMRGDMPKAERLLRESLAIAHETGAIYETGMICLALGRLLIEQKGEREEGCALLRESLRQNTLMGTPEAEEARETLQRLGCGESAG